jgi:putative aldouronate transport system permease protein
MSQSRANVPARRRMSLASRRRMRQNIPLFAMFIPVIAFYVIFKYLPMGGLVIAFKKYNFAKGIWGSPWAGLYYFDMLFKAPATLNIIRNTFVLSVLRIVFGFPAPILLALLLNEMRCERYKKTLQTVLYIPHFFSWVIVGGLVATIFSQETGIVNAVIKRITGEPYPFLYREGSWMAIFIGSGVWKGMGYGTIIYMAALTAIDPSYYEAAVLDGANKAQQIFYITLPCIKSTVITLFILQTGSVMEVGFDQVYALKNNVVNNVADVISTYVYRMGIQGAKFSPATAMGLFDSLVGLVLVLVSNRVAKAFGESLW